MSTNKKIVESNQNIEVGENALSPDGKEFKDVILLEKTNTKIVLLEENQQKE